MFSKFWSCFSETQDPDESNTIKLNYVFANRSKENETFPLTVKELKQLKKQIRFSHTSLRAMPF